MKIVVLAGGISTEREVSLISGKQIYIALKEKGHQVVLVDLFLGYQGEKADDIFSLEKDWAEGITAVSEQAPDLDAIRKMREDGGKCLLGPNVLDICRQGDIVFMALHGANGEDGKIQALFELYNIPYTGTDYLSSAIAMDKALTKDLFRANHIPTPQGYSIKIGEPLQKMEYPVVVKVNTGGSSIGVYIVKNAEELTQAMEEAKSYDDRVVIEQFIEGREFSCGVIDGKALPIIEIAPKQGFYDFKNKYQQGMTRDICPANLEDELTRKCQKVIEDAYRALRLKSYARIDFILNEKEEIFVLEANTLPGMTPSSLLPQEAAAQGMDFKSLCEKLIEVSLRSYSR